MVTFCPRAIFSKTLLLLLLGLPAQASTMPAADRLQSGLSLSSGPAGGAAWQIAERGQLGLSAAVPFYYFSDFGTQRYGAYGLYQLFYQDGFFIAGVAGVYGDLFWPDLDRYATVGLQMGAAFAYQLNRQLTLRVNIVPGVSLRLPPTGWVVVPPAGGVEISWRSAANLEWTAGYNGNGDILGVNWLF
ncbi:MAG: hypothetical protein ACO1RX_11075 [Candidatus Sericytochromatia bacterium]